MSASIAWVAAATLFAYGISRLDRLYVSFAPETPDWMPEQATLRVIALGIIGTAALTVVIASVLRYRRRRLVPSQVARRLDRIGKTDDLVATALAAENGDAAGNEQLAAIVTNRARARLTELPSPIDRFVAPTAAAACLGLTAAILGLVVDPDGGFIDVAVGTANAAEDLAEAETIPPLSDSTLERLERDANLLAELENKPALRDDVREQLAAARRHLESVRADPSRSLSSLSKAERALREVARQARDEGLFDEDKLEKMRPQELAENMTEALERGENDTASAMAEEMERRIEDADDREMRRMAEALDEAFEKMPPRSEKSGESGESGKRDEKGSERGESGERGEKGSEDGASGEKGSEDGERRLGTDAGETGSESGKSGSESEGRTKEELRRAAEDGERGSEAGERGSEAGERGSEAGERGSEAGERGSEAGERRSSAKSGAESGGEKLRERAEALSERLRAGDSGSARAEARKLAEELGKKGSGGESVEGNVDKALEDIRRARSEQLGKMNGKGKGDGKGKGEEGKGDGEGKGEGKGRGEGLGEGKGALPGEGPRRGEGPPTMGDSFGLPSGKPGPGGGKGSDEKGPDRALSKQSGTAPEQVDSPLTGQAQGAVRVIRRFAEGHRDTGAYNELHNKYESIAESAVRREQIPLTRRDYIRNYFQAVRGQ